MGAKADPAADAWYGYYGYPGYYGHRYYGYGGYYGHRYGYGYWGRKKREADPAVLASSSALTAPQTVDLPLVHPYAYGVGAPLLAAPAAAEAVTEERKKRDAEPEADAAA